MKAVRNSHSETNLNRRAFVVTTWRRLGEPKVGRNELLTCQDALVESFGQAGAESPAAIARILADAGAELRHPEIIELDAAWRESQIQVQAKKLGSLATLSPEKRLRLGPAASLIEKLEKLRRRFDRAGEDQLSKHVRTWAIDARRTALSRAQNHSLADAQRAEQAEIAEWFGIWLQTPNLFEQWLELRKSSLEFKRKFSALD